MDWDFSPQILIQGIDQPQAKAYLQQGALSQNCVVAGISDQYLDEAIASIPVFDLVSAVIAEDILITTSLIFSPPYHVLDAFYEAVASQIKQVVIQTAKIPPLDLMKLYQKAQSKGIHLLGPSGAGILLPDKYCCGVNNASMYSLGQVALINFAHPTLSQEISLQIQESNLGISTLVNLGSSYFAQINWHLWLNTLANNEQTEAIVIILSQLSSLEADSLIMALNKFNTKPVIIYLLDTQNWYERISIPKASVIADKIYQHLYAISAIELIQECNPQDHVKVTDNYQDIVPILRQVINN